MLYDTASTTKTWWRDPAVEFAAGSLGGFCAKFVEFPLDTVKVQLQTQAPRGGRGGSSLDAFHHIQSLVVREGPAVLYRGLPMPLVGTMVEMACLFATFGQVKSLLFGRRTEPLTTWEIASAGGVSGCFISFILTPIELIKCRMQVTTKARYKNTGDCIAQAFQCDGLRGFRTSIHRRDAQFPRFSTCGCVLVKGIVPTMWREIPGTASWFATYHVSLDYLRGDKADKKSDWDVIAAGALSGIAYNGAFYPADTVKSLVQTHPTHRRSMDVVKEVYALHGVGGFYRGFTPTVLRAIPANAVLFYTYEEFEVTTPPARHVSETPRQRQDRLREEKLSINQKKLADDLAACASKQKTEDAYKTLFVGRISYETTEKQLRRELERYGDIVNLRLVEDEDGKCRGYAFVEYKDEGAMKAAYKNADGKKIDGRRVVVDVERGRTVRDWKPRKLGGGIGDTRLGGADVNVKYSG
ncbi:hypothetical protein DYB34_012006, partial [Aphanomyces astaci]